jgi:glycosyltransferase involved in cell wall biosynthesis
VTSLPSGLLRDRPDLRGLPAQVVGALHQDAGDDARESHAPVRVLVLIPTLEVGGAEQDLVRNLPRLDPARFEVVVWTFQTQGALAPILLERGIEVVGPGFDQASAATRPTRWQAALAFCDRHPYLQRLSRAARLLGNVHAGARLIRARNFDIVHAVLPNAYLLAVLANALAGSRPLVMSRVSQNWYQKDYPFFSFVERHVLHRAVDAAIGNSHAILQELRLEGFARHKLSLVHNGIDVVAFDAEAIDRRSARARLGIPNDALVFSSVANLHVYKGHTDLIEALSMARSRLPQNWLLLVAGAGFNGNLDRLTRLVGERGLTSHVRFLGQRLDVPVVLSAADIHVSASHSEGFPNNVLEAMCARLPVVATAVGGVPEQVLDGVTGLLVPPRNPPELSEVLAALAGDPDRGALLGRRARRRVEREFSIERSVAGFEDVYAGLVRRGDHRGPDRSGPRHEF